MAFGGITTHPIAHAMSDLQLSVLFPWPVLNEQDKMCRHHGIELFAALSVMISNGYCRSWGHNATVKPQLMIIRMSWVLWYFCIVEVRLNQILRWRNHWGWGEVNMDNIVQWRTMLQNVPCLASIIPTTTTAWRGYGIYIAAIVYFGSICVNEIFTGRCHLGGHYQFANTPSNSVLGPQIMYQCCLGAFCFFFWSGISI